MKVFILIIVAMVLGTIVSDFTNSIGGLITTVVIIAIAIILTSGNDYKPNLNA